MKRPMIRRAGRAVLAGLMFSTVVAQAAPNLAPGVWTFVGPAASTLDYGSSGVAIDPSNPRTIYCTTDNHGLWKSVDGGSNWVRLGDPSQIGFPTTGYLDTPIRVAVDPNNSQHLYATDGVRNDTMGFWVSWDGGVTWTVPQGFRDARTTRDVTQMSVHPTNFNHILLSSHSAWDALGYPNAGVMESRDGGVTWTALPPPASWPNGSMGVTILHHPASGTGDANTYLVGTDGNGFWRTTTAGRINGTAALNYQDGTPSASAWTQVAANINIIHGGHQNYYTAAGVLYAGATQHPVRSTNNGLTWQVLNDVPFSHYFAIRGDGNTLYISHSYPAKGGFGNAPFHSSPESDGLSWDPYQGGAQAFNNGPASMAFDPVNRIMYAAMWDNGLWALKVLDGTPGDGVPPARPKGLRAR